MMNEITPVPTTRPDTGQSNTAEARRAGLERSRRSATANQVANAEQAQARRAEQFRQNTEIIQRAIGANTRLEIAEGQGSNPFTYRAIDIDSGEVVSEWPPADFADLLNTLSADITGSTIDVTGILVNENA